MTRRPRAASGRPPVHRSGRPGPRLLLMLLALLPIGTLAHLPAGPGDALHPLAGHARLLLDASRKLDVEDVLAACEAGECRPLRPWESRFGYTQARLWLVIDLPPALAKARVSDLLLEWALLDEVHLYHLRRGRVIGEQSTGSSMPLADRPVPMRGLALPIAGFDAREDQLVLSVATRGNLSVTAWLTTPAGLDAWSSREDLLSASFYGAMLVLLVLNGLLFTLTGVRSLLYYCLFTAATTGHHILSHDMLPRLAPHIAFTHLHEIYLLCVLLSGVAAILFTRHALVLPRATPRLDQAIQILGTLTAAGAVAIPLLGVTTSYRLAGTLALIANPVLIAASAIRWRQGDLSARTLVLAWSLLLVGIMLMALYRTGILPVAVVTEDDTYLLSAVASLLLCLAVFHRLLLLGEEGRAPVRALPDGPAADAGTLVLQGAAADGRTPDAMRASLRGAAADGDRMIEELEQSVRARNRELRAANERLEAVRHETERHAQTLNALFTSSVKMHRSDDADAMVEHSLEQLAELFPEHAFGIVVHGERAGDIRHRAFVRMTDEEERTIVDNAQLLGEGVRSTLRSLLLSGPGSTSVADPASPHGGWQFLDLGDQPRASRGYLIIRGPDLPERSLDVLGVFCTQLATALENRRLSSELESLANTDPLTGIGNRKVLDAALAPAMAHASSRPRIHFCALVIDLNGLKQINDRLGHEAGDEAIRHVAEVISAIIRREDTVARTGGDEFVVICPSARPDTGPELAERIRQRLAETPIRVSTLDGGEAEFEASVSIGTACTHDTQVEDIMARADARMYDAKQQHYADRSPGPEDGIPPPGEGSRRARRR